MRREERDGERLDHVVTSLAYISKLRLALHCPIGGAYLVREREKDAILLLSKKMIIQTLRNAPMYLLSLQPLSLSLSLFH